MKSLPPPYNLEAEQAVLGSILIKQDTLNGVSDLIGPQDFYRSAHRRIYQTILDIDQRVEPLDLVTLTFLLKERWQLEEVGGAVFLAGLTEQVGTAAHAEHYARIVHDKAVLRRLISIFQEITGAANASGANSKDILLYANSLLEDISRKNGQPRCTGLCAITAADLNLREFTPPRWAVPDLFPSGLSILAGKPKSGKSWLALGMAVSVTTGGMALGKIKVEPGAALYLALEDGLSRLKTRLEKIIPIGPFPKDLHFLTAKDFPPLVKGGLEALDLWLSERPEVRFVVIDTLARVKPQRGRNADAYDHDSAIIATLQGIAIKHDLALLVVHHTRKADSSDFLECVSGTFGLTGAADCIAVLSRQSRQAADATLKITGRDVPDLEKALKFHADLGSWELLGEADDFAMGQERQDLLSFLKEVGPKTPAQLSKLIGKSRESIKMLLFRMRESGLVKANSRGEYLALSL